MRARPWAVPLAAALATLALLVPFVAVDPPTGVTFSDSPFTDEAWYLLGARNLVLFGHWGGDDWRLHLLTLPYALLQAGTFAVLGVGIVQARLTMIAATALTAALLGAGLRRHFGAAPALVAALGFSTSSLVLYYGRLAYAELLVAACLVAAALFSSGRDGSRPGRSGMLAGVALALAVGSKPTALAPALGILLGVAISGRLDAPTRRWLGAASAVVALAAAAWAAMAWLPDPAALEAALRILAPQELPRDLSQLVERAAAYALRNDGALAGSAPLLAAGMIGLVLTALGSRGGDPATRAGRPARTLVAAAAGWWLVGLAFLLVLSYRPNRYVVPLLPALAILAGAGLQALQERLRTANAPRLAPLALASVLVLLSGPGLIRYAGWLARTGSELPATQATVAGLVADGMAVEGAYAPAFALAARSVILVSRPDSGINEGDLYAQRGVRWLVLGPGERPAWADAHPEAWATRTERLCIPWGETHRPVCLLRLP